MKPVTVSILKKELRQHSQQDLIELCLQLAKFKKENKELLTYVLFDSKDEDEYIRAIKEEIDLEFSKINHDRLYFIKKSTRKILRLSKSIFDTQKRKKPKQIFYCTFALS